MATCVNVLTFQQNKNPFFGSVVVIVNSIVIVEFCVWFIVFVYCIIRLTACTGTKVDRFELQARREREKNHCVCLTI